MLVAAVEAFLDPESGSETLQAASGSAFPVVIVNGPIGTRIRLNAGFGCLGPDPQRPAGASIGRALRLLQQNLGGALPGIGTMANYGGLRYTNVAFAEDETDLPAGWMPHGTERHGFAPGTSSISLAFANGATNIRRRGAKKETPEEDALQGMHRMADFMRVPNMAGLAGYEHGTPGILMIPGVVAQTMAGLGSTRRTRCARSSGSTRGFRPSSFVAREARRGSRSTRARWLARASPWTRGRSPPAPTTS